MLVGFSEQDYQSWNNNMHKYEKQKRTKKPFGKQFKPLPQIVNTQQIKQKQRQFNPVLQRYNDQQKQIKQLTKQQNSRILSIDRYYRTIGRKNARDYDIINLYGNQNKTKDNNLRTKAPVRNLYNPINNQLVPQYYYRNRQLKLSPQKVFKNIKPQGRDFDIVTGIYHYDHQFRKQQQNQENNRQIKEKYENTHDYNPVYGKYYDASRQAQYENGLAKSQQIQSSGQQYNKRFPPGYINRQPLILDQTKPLTQSLIALDNRRQKTKQRYKLRYLIQNEYEKRNIQHQQREERRMRNRMHNSLSIDQKAKQFDLPQLCKIKDELAYQVFSKGKVSKQKISEYNPQASSEVSNRQANDYSSRSSVSNRSQFVRGSIKSGGFS